MGFRRFAGWVREDRALVLGPAGGTDLGLFERLLGTAGMTTFALTFGTSSR